MTRPKHAARIGSIVSGTLNAADTIPAFLDELRRLRGTVPRDLLRVSCRALDGGQDDSDPLLDVANDLIAAIEEYAPPFCYFGAHPGDAADFGFWPSPDFQRLAEEDGAIIVKDLSEVLNSYSGYVLHINDHGNATLYHARGGTRYRSGPRKGRSRGCGSLTEIWSIV